MQATLYKFDDIQMYDTFKLSPAEDAPVYIKWAITTAVDIKTNMQRTVYTDSTVYRLPNNERIVMTNTARFADGRIKATKGAVGVIRSYDRGRVGVLFDPGTFYVEHDGSGRLMQLIDDAHYKQCDSYVFPDWVTGMDGKRVMDWRNYISQDLKDMWLTLSTELRVVIAQNAQDIADTEEWD
jgi:hypothetical protein